MAEVWDLEVFCPAKVNLFLAVTGTRGDGYHELVSLMAPLDIGDHLRLSRVGDTRVEFRCTDPTLPVDGGNLVLRAVEAFRSRHAFSGGLSIELEKVVPVGAGLGGGSSDAAGMLLALNRLLENPLEASDLQALAASVGSDCPFFLAGKAAIVRGRGERVEAVPEKAAARLRGRRLLLVRPSFPVSTAWAFGAMKRRGSDYLDAPAAEGKLKRWSDGEEPLESLLFNNMEPAVFDKFVPLAVLKKELGARFGRAVLMSGSGSTMLILLREAGDVVAISDYVREAGGGHWWIAEVVLS